MIRMSVNISRLVGYTSPTRRGESELQPQHVRNEVGWLAKTKPHVFDVSTGVEPVYRTRAPPSWRLRVGYKLGKGVEFEDAYRDSQELLKTLVSIVGSDLLNVDGIIGYSSDLKSFPYWTIRPKFPDDSAEQVLYVASVYDDSSVTPSGDPINILIPDASPKLRTAGFKVYEPEEIKVCDSSRRVVEEGIERAFSDWSIDLRPSLEDLISRYNLPMFGFSSPKPFLAVVHDVRKGTSDTEVASFLRQLANTLGVYKSLRAYAEMYVARSHHILQSFNPFRMSYSRDKYRLYGRPQIH